MKMEFPTTLLRCLKFSGHRRSIVVLLGMFFLLPSIQPALADAPVSNVTVVLSGKGAIYKQFMQGFSGKLRLPHQGAPTIRVTVLELDANGRYQAAIRPENMMVVTVGTAATAAVLKDKNWQGPILSTLIPHLAFQALSNSEDGNNREISAIYLDEPIKRYLLLAKITVPDITSIGVVLGPGTRSQSKQIALLCKKLGLKPVIKFSGTNSRNPLSEIEYVARRSQAILALPDRDVYNRFTITDILLTAYHHVIPIIGYSSAITKAGALAAVYTTSKQAGQQTATTVLGSIRNDSINLPPPRYPDVYNIDINREVANSLRMSLPDDATVLMRLKQLERQ